MQLGHVLCEWNRSVMDKAGSLQNSECSGKLVSERTIRPIKLQKSHLFQYRVQFICQNSIKIS